MPTSNPKLEVYKASAGSGKTYQLALKYICLLLGERQEDGTIRLYKNGDRKMHREILAITFTNKATNEMKQRIISELMLLSDVTKKSKYRADIIKLTGANAHDLADAARRALTSMLYDYGKIQVSTIDSFFQRVLRSFAYEANLSGNYELSLDEEGIISNAIADTLTQVCGFKSKLPIDRRRVELIKSWVDKIIDNRYNSADDVRVFDKDNSARSALVNFIKTLNNETYKAMADDMAEFFEDPDAIDNLVAELQQKLDELKASIDVMATSAIALSPTDKKNKILKDTSRKWLEGMLPLKPLAPTAAFASYISGEKDVNSMCMSGKATAAILGELNDLMPVLKDYWTVATMLDQMYNLGLFYEMLDVASRMKVRLNTILLSDTNAMLNKIIGGSDAPFIYERTGERLHHFLIDEFQDTSMLQWENLRPLVANSLASGYDNMIIGDVKQCIYRFRNSYPELLDTKLEDEKYLKQWIELPPINTNWRSSKEVVEFNNNIFENLGKEYGLKSYSGVRQKINSDALNGYVNVASASDFSQTYVERMLENMTRQLKSGYKPSDIVVLVRWNRLGVKIVNALQQYTLPGRELEGISIVSNDSLFLKHSNAVNYIVAQLRELDRIWNKKASNDTQSKRSVRTRVTERDFDWIKEELRVANSKGLNAKQAIDAVMKAFDDTNRPNSLIQSDEERWRKEMRGRSPFEVVERLIATLPEDQWRKTEAQYIAAFQDLVIDYCSHNTPSIHGFLKLWDEKLEQKSTVDLTEGANAIRVLTIHSSKGLEFDCVHLVLDSDSFESETDYRWYDARHVFEDLKIKCSTPEFFPLKSSEGLDSTKFKHEYVKLKSEQFVDELNALYVGMTRAKRELIATFKAPSERGQKSLTPSTVVRKALPHEYQTKSEWVYEAGTPTHWEADNKDKENDVIYPMYINEYEVVEHLDKWHSTHVGDYEESSLS